jgi:hypothetical protein
MYVTISVGAPLACAAVAESARGLTIVALSLLTKPGEESLAVAVSITGSGVRIPQVGTSRAVVMLACLSQGRRGASRWQATAGNGADKEPRTSVAILTDV